jgi:hypothetical protein
MAGDNTLADFPADSFAIFVWCDACRHNGTFDHAKVPEEIRMRTLHE